MSTSDEAFERMDVTMPREGAGVVPRRHPVNPQMSVAGPRLCVGRRGLFKGAVGFLAGRRCRKSGGQCEIGKPLRSRSSYSSPVWRESTSEMRRTLSGSGNLAREQAGLGHVSRVGCCPGLATSPHPSRATSTRIRFAARDITARGGRFFPSARQAATVVRKRAAIVPQHPHVLICRSIVRRRAAERSPSR